MNIPNDLPQHKVIKRFNSAIAPLIFHVYILKLNTSNFVTTWTVQIAQSLTFLPCKHKDLSPIPRSQVQKKKKESWAGCNSCTGECKTGGNTVLTGQ